MRSSTGHHGVRGVGLRDVVDQVFRRPASSLDPFDDDDDVFVPPLDVVARRTARAPRRGTRAVVAIARGGARARATDAMASRSADRSRRVRVTSRRDLDGAATMTASTVRIEMDARVGAGDRALRAFASSSGQSRGARTRGTVTTTNDDDDDDDPRWVVCSGRPFRGRVRVIADANALASLVVERVTVEWVGRERVGAEERSVARSPPGEVARALTLEPGSTVGLKFGIDLPPGLAPSFRGEHSRYWYRVTCKATTASGETLEASAPLTVRAGDWDLERRGEDDGELCDDVGDDDDVGEMRETYSARDLTAPWIHIEDTVPPESPRFNGSLASPRALQMWGDVEPQVRTPRESSTPQAGEGSVFTPQSHGQRKKSKAYVVSMGEDRLVKVTLRKPAPKCAIGGEVAGILDFTCAEPGKRERPMCSLRSSRVKLYTQRPRRCTAASRRCIGKFGYKRTSESSISIPRISLLIYLQIPLEAFEHQKLSSSGSSDSKLRQLRRLRQENSRRFSKAKSTRARFRRSSGYFLSTWVQIG